MALETKVIPTWGEGLLDTENVERCTRCGFCLAVCPTYNETWVETQSPRGRVNLIRAVARGEMEPGEGFREHMYHCLYCMACEAACPSGVKIAHRIAEARVLVEERRKQPWLKTLMLRHVLPYPGRLELLTWPLRLYQHLGLRWLAHRLALVHLLPRRLRDMEASLPVMPWRPLRRIIPRVLQAKGEVRYRVGFFLGCVMSLAFARASSATARVLQENGCEVITPKEQKCCGAPHENDGDLETMKKLARHNIGVFERLGVDYIVADCAACSATNKAYAHLLHDDPEYAARAAAYSAKALDITEFLAQIPLKVSQRALGITATLHEACHLCHAQGISQEPRQVLGSIPGVELREMRESNWCCGSAGSYTLTHHRRSMEILRRKMESVEATGAEVVVTSNPGCLLQLNIGVAERKAGIRVAHISELLAEAYEKDV